MPGGIQPKCCGDSKEREITFECRSLPPGFWWWSCLYFSSGRNSHAGHSETLTGQGCGGKMCYTVHPQMLFLLWGFLSLFSPFKPFSQIQCCRTQPHIQTTICFSSWRKKKQEDDRSIIVPNYPERGPYCHVKSTGWTPKQVPCPPQMPRGFAIGAVYEKSSLWPQVLG